MGNFSATLDAFRGDLQATYVNTYNKKMKGDPRVGDLMELGLPSDKRQEIYGYPLSAPTVDYWQRGNPIPRETSSIVTFEVDNDSFGKAFEFHEDDLNDVGKVMGAQAWVRGIANRGTQLPDRVAFQIMDGTTNRKLLPGIPLAPDGVGLFSALDGDGNPRYGYSGPGTETGNIVKGAGYSPDAIRSTFLDKVIPYYLGAQDTKGEPLNDQTEVESGLLVVCNSRFAGAFGKAFQQGRTLEEGTVGAAATSNYILDGGYKIKLWATQRKAATSWVVRAINAGPKPLLQQVRLALRSIDEDRSNSDRARNTKQNAFQVDLRHGYGVGPAYTACQVDET